MEPQESGDIDKEQLTRRRREQDKDWEDSRIRELGSNAILGPTSSPRKRIKDQEEGAGAGIANKKRRKLKHEVLQEGWGELPLRGGADSEKPGATLEQEQPSTHGEPGSTLGPVEQQMKQDTRAGNCCGT